MFFASDLYPYSGLDMSLSDINSESGMANWESRKNSLWWESIYADKLKRKMGIQKL